MFWDSFDFQMIILFEEDFEKINQEKDVEQIKEIVFSN